MTDLELTKLCAEAMGIQLFETSKGEYYLGDPLFNPAYDPLHDDAQAMALVKKFHIYQAWDADGEYWDTELWEQYPQLIGYRAFGPDLNRAICECVAKMQKARVR